jgi:hypothetical protein
MLITLIAPRPVFIVIAEKDLWSDIRGEFLSAKHADPVYKILETEGFNAKDMPSIHQPVLSTIGYCIHEGDHNLLKYDKERFLEFADYHLENI